MAARLKTDDSKSPRRPPATTPEARENQLIDAAVSLAERQILDGTASSQVITHFLKLASSRERLEQQRLGLEAELLAAKAEAMAAAAKQEDLYANALAAMRSYSGQGVPDEEYERKDEY